MRRIPDPIRRMHQSHRSHSAGRRTHQALKDQARRRDTAATFAKMDVSIRALARAARARIKQLNRELRRDGQMVEDDWDELI
jgi:hypothetical protein